MVKVFSRALREYIAVDRIIGRIASENPGPTVVFIAGMHGNEPSGVFALKALFDALQTQDLEYHGTVYGVCGNLKALARGERYQVTDLNRIWTDRRMNQLVKGYLKPTDEDQREQVALFETLNDIIGKEQGPFYFIDLHSTSSETIPFTLFNDSLLNRAYVKQYPLPMVLGIEEYLEGTILSYLNSLGYVSFGYEAGQHDALKTVENQIAFIYLTLHYTGCLELDNEQQQKYYSQLKGAANQISGAFEIFQNKKLQEEEIFKMLPGFYNFKKVTKNESLAFSNGSLVTSPKSGHIFMPLYQKKGDGGFYLIRQIPVFFLWLSKCFRTFELKRILPMLPGVKINQKQGNQMVLNKGTARFLAKPFLHLLGFRARQLYGEYLIVSDRETYSRTNEYYGQKWLRPSLLQRVFKKG